MAGGLAALDKSDALDHFCVEATCTACVALACVRRLRGGAAKQYPAPHEADRQRGNGASDRRIGLGAERKCGRLCGGVAGRRADMALERIYRQSMGLGCPLDGALCASSYVTLHSRSYFASRYAGTIGNNIAHASNVMRDIIGQLLWELLPFCRRGDCGVRGRSDHKPGCCVDIRGLGGGGGA